MAANLRGTTRGSAIAMRGLMTGVARTISSIPRTAVFAAPVSGVLVRAIPNVAMKQVTQVRYYAGGVEKTINCPTMADSISSGIVLEWQVVEGQEVPEDTLLTEIETDKTTQQIVMPESGKITKLIVGKGKRIEVGKPLYKMVPGPVSGKAAAAPKTAPAPTPAPASNNAAPASTPAPTPVAAAPKPAPAAKPLEMPTAKAPTGGRSEKREPMTGIRKKTAARLKESQNNAAMLTTFQDCDMSNVIALRNKYKDTFEKKHGVKLGFMSFFAKAASKALEQQGIVNAVIDGDDIVYRNYIDISVAVAAPRGLVVPVIRNVETLSFADIEKTIAVYGDKAKNNRLTLEEMTGGTFTISNGGVFGSLFGTPIINMPQSAILGMHATFDRPVAVNGKVEIRPMMYLALTYDHRIIDGREAVTFLKRIKTSIEEPASLLLDL